MMRPLTNVLRRYVLFPFLLPVFYVQHGVRYYFGNISAGEALPVLGMYLAIAGALFGLARIALKRNTGAGLLALLAMILFLYWAEIVRVINGAFGLVNYTHLPFVLLLWLAASYLIARLAIRLSMQNQQRIVLLLNLFFVANILLESGWCVSKSFFSKHKTFLAETAAAAEIRAGRASAQDVYLLLMDEYASSPSLRKQYGWDNSGMDSFLQSRHFAVRPQSRANYQLTFFSMASMLNMEYVGTAITQQAIRQPEEVQAYRCIRENEVARRFRAAGYDFYNCSIFEVAGQPKPYLYDLISTGHTILTVNNLAHVAMRDYIPYLRHRRAIHEQGDFHDPGLYAFDNYNKSAAAKVCSLAAVPHAKPQFVYAHFLMPHAPFYYDSSGAYLPPVAVKTTLTERQPQLYCYNVAHANSELKRMVDTILQRSGGNAVILIIGDHGFRSHEAERHNRAALFRNYFAVYFPDGDYNGVPAAPTNVNLFRIVFNKLLGTSYPMLPDSTVELRGQEGSGRF